MLLHILLTSSLLFLFTFLSKISFFLVGVTPFSHEVFSALFWGLQLDLTTVAIFSTLCLVINLIVGLFIAKNSILGKLPLMLASCWIILTTSADAMYFIETGRHVTFEVFTGDGSESGLFITSLIKYTSQSVIAFILCILAITITLKIKFPSIYSPNKIKINVASMLVWLILAVTAIRGGWSDHPQSPMSVYKIGQPHLAEIAWNAPYAISYYLVKGVKNAAHRVTPVLKQEDVSKARKLLPLGQDTKLDNLKPLNIIFVLLESWGSADMHSYSGSADAAPFFDKLRETSFSPSSMYANGFRTIEGMFASFCSYSNPIGSAVAGTQLQNMNYRCLPSILHQHGWETHFVQGSGKGIVGAFAQTLGFEHSHGKHDYTVSNSPQNFWGYMDDGIYQYSLNKINKLKSPYFIAINTGTTHDSYLPNDEDYHFGLKSKEQIRHSVLYHADHSLEKFLSELNTTITEPTLVVLMSDHTAGMPHTGLQRNSIPFLMYGINTDVPNLKPNINASQRDVAPSILDLMDGSARWFTGQSMLTSNYNGSADFSQGKSVNWIKNNKLVQINAETGKVEQCAIVAENTIDVEPRSCENTEFQMLIQEAKAYTSYSQQLLYDGKTVNYS